MFSIHVVYEKIQLNELLHTNYIGEGQAVDDQWIWVNSALTSKVWQIILLLNFQQLLELIPNPLPGNSECYYNFEIKSSSKCQYIWIISRDGSTNKQG